MSSLAHGIEKLSDTILIKTFSDAFTVMVSEDETVIVVLTGDSNMDFFEIDGKTLISSAKVHRNAWLERAYFSDDKKTFYYDFGVWAKTKYRKLDLASGKNENIKCFETPKGCSYESLKCCLYAKPILKLQTKPIIFIAKDVNIEMYQIKE